MTSGSTLPAVANQFAAASGVAFAARSCRPYRARKTGKVERPIGYLWEDVFYGRKFVNDADLNE